MTLSEELRARVREDQERQKEIERRRDEARAAQDKVVLVSTAEKQRLEQGNIDMNGDILRARYLVVAFRTHEHDERGHRLELDKIEDVARLIRQLLRLGYLTVMVEDVEKIRRTAG